MYRREGKEMKEEEEGKGSEVEAFKIIQVRKNPNSSRKCVFGWFELGFEVGFEFVLVWSWICLVKRAKNATFLFNLDARHPSPRRRVLRLDGGQVSSF